MGHERETNMVEAGQVCIGIVGVAMVVAAMVVAVLFTIEDMRGGK